MAEHYIELVDVHKSYTLGKTRVTALKGVSVQFPESRFCCIIGPSGCGKTTTLNLIGGIDTADAGSVLVGGQNMQQLNDNQLTDFRAYHMGFIFQSFNLIPVLNVRENVGYQLMMTRPPRKEAEEKISAVIKEVGLSHWERHRPNELSGGQRQRVAIARALVVNPKLVIADEPTANLDSKSGTMILELMKSLQHMRKTTFIFATHDPQVIEYVDTVYKMKDGVIENEK